MEIRLLFYSTAMGDVLLEREFNYLLYGTLHVLPPEYIRLIQDGCQRNAKMIFSLLIQ